MNDAIKMAMKQAQKTMRKGMGGPFGCTIVDKEGSIVAVNSNRVLIDHDPTAHAEITTIREACKKLGTHDLSGCVIYATGYPCPMCLSAIVWANIKTCYYACTLNDAEEIGFRDDYIFRFIENERKDESVLKLIQTGREDCLRLFKEYHEQKKEMY